MSYGSGSLFQRGKKKIWYYQLWVDGKQLGPYSSRSTKKADAKLALDKLIGKRARGEILQAGTNYDTVADILTHYIAYARERLKSASIIESVLKAHVLPYIGRFRLAQCDIHRLRRYRKDRSAEGADDATINRELSYLRAAWRRALKEGRVSHQPYFPIVKEDNARQGHISEQECGRFLRELPAYLRGFAACLYFGGLRRGEAVRLMPSDVDLCSGFILVRKSKNDTARGVPILDGPMSEHLEWSLDHSSPEHLFLRPDGRPVTIRNFYADWHAAAERAGIPGFIPHDGRRSANRNMRDNGIPQALRMKALGWLSPEMDRRYGVVDLADMEMVREKMNARKKA